MEPRWVRWLRVAGGVGFLALAVVTKLSIAAAGVWEVVPCNPDMVFLCLTSAPLPSPDWTPVVALGAVGIVLLWPRRRRTADEPAR